MADLGAPESRSNATDANPGTATAPQLPAPAQPLRGLRRALLLGLHLVPKNAMSRWMGRFASIALPGPIQRAEIELFAKLANVDLSEARDPVDHYASLQKFFTRALKAGVRPIEGDDDTIVAPCDGAWGASGRIESGVLIQVKGRSYRVAELLGDEGLASAYEGGCFATFYLSPRDYHRFHTPLAGRFVRLDYHPGSLWPVNSIGLQGIDGLFARNERICAFLVPPRAAMSAQDARSGNPSGAADSLDAGADFEASRAIALVAVGATMVGSVKLTFDSMTTNLPGGRRVIQELGVSAPAFARGQEWGHFEFGSTIVMLTPPGPAEIVFRPIGEALRLGQVIGRMRR